MAPGVTGKTLGVRNEDFGGPKRRPFYAFSHSCIVGTKSLLPICAPRSNVTNALKAVLVEQNSTITNQMVLATADMVLMQLIDPSNPLQQCSYASFCIWGII